MEDTTILTTTASTAIYTITNTLPPHLPHSSNAVTLESIRAMFTYFISLHPKPPLMSPYVYVTIESVSALKDNLFDTANFGNAGYNLNRAITANTTRVYNGYMITHYFFIKGKIVYNNATERGHLWNFFKDPSTLVTHLRSNHEHLKIRRTQGIDTFNNDTMAVFNNEKMCQNIENSGKLLRDNGLYSRDFATVGDPVGNKVTSIVEFISEF